MRQQVDKMCSRHCAGLASATALLLAGLWCSAQFARAGSLVSTPIRPTTAPADVRRSQNTSEFKFGYTRHASPDAVSIYIEDKVWNELLAKKSPFVLVRQIEKVPVIQACQQAVRCLVVWVEEQDESEVLVLTVTVISPDKGMWSPDFSPYKCWKKPWETCRDRFVVKMVGKLTELAGGN